jgi:TolB protein
MWRIGGRVLWAIVGIGVAAVVDADRRGLYPQIDLPHPYYYHEMYLPQLTSGPSSVTFSPDSREVIYSMAGSLWRQRLDSTAAVQLTDGPGYDYQPDWSPDGRSVIYVTYRHDALELARLDLASGVTTLLTTQGAVNVEPKISPDGTRLVWTSTGRNGHLHLYLADLTSAGLEHTEALTADVKSPLRRYYYSAYDHDINPTWTRDGRSIVFVSNRGHVHGTGGFVEMAAQPGALATEIHYEETNWRARPEFSPDGSKLLYSSYLGRNSHQLWVLPANGGADAFPLSYGDDDAVGARWSPDGRTIAFISNRAGGLELWLQDAATGAQRRLEIDQRQTRAPTVHLHLKVRDAAGQIVAARVSVTDAAGRTHAPKDAWIAADDGFDRAERPFEAHYFHSHGDDVIDVPAGPVTVDVLKGFTRPLATARIDLSGRAGATVPLVLQLGPAWSLQTAGGRWVSGDVHVHMNYAGLYRNDPAHLKFQADAEDLNLVHAVIVNKEQRFPDIAYSGHGLDPVSDDDHAIWHGQEYHTSFWGHLGLIGLERATLIPGYAGYPNTAASSVLPMNLDVADRARAGGALVGYVHPFDEPVHPLDAREPLSHELPVDVALGRVDYMEILGFSDHRITAGVWYRLLDLGYRIPAAGGTDAMADFASLRGPVGMNRTFVATEGGARDVAGWLAGLKAGHSFASNGPLLDLTLGAQPIGGEVALPHAGPVAYHAHLRSMVPLDHLDLVCTGGVVHPIPLGGDRTQADVDGVVEVKTSGWCLLRASADHGVYPVLDLYPYATTSPIYLSVAGRPTHSAAAADYFLAWIDRIGEAVRAYPDWNRPEDRRVVDERLAAARAAIDARR